MGQETKMAPLFSLLDIVTILTLTTPSTYLILAAPPVQGEMGRNDDVTGKALDSCMGWL